MHRYFIQISFKGTQYNGWQKQPNGLGVQEVLEKTLSTFFRHEIEVTGAGRTDTGVHATYYIAHFDLPQPIIDSDDTVYRINNMLPHDICANAVFEVKPEAHARFSAISRTYIYKLHYQKDPFQRELSCYFTRKLDIDLMNKACEILLATTDFTSFCKLHSDNKTNICHLTQARWDSDGNNTSFYISADRFLRNMVRAVVGTCLELGYGKITLEQFRNIVESKDRCKAGTSAPAHGLYLIDVEYPDDIYID